MFCSLLLVLCCQTPQPGVGGDVIKLKIGTELVGTITHETEEYVEIKIAGGAIFGIDKARTQSIIRSASTRPDPEPSPRDELARSYDEWYALHDGEGRVVGSLHSSRTYDENGRIRYGEEWSFADQGLETELTFLEVVDADRTPLSAFYHERTRVPGAPRVKTDRVVHAVLRDNKLHVSKRSTEGSSRQTYDLAGSLRFPLEAMHEFADKPPALHETGERSVYVPRREEFITHSYDVGRTRQVWLDNQRRRIRILRVEAGQRSNSIWLSRAGRPLRREINGAALVAVPSNRRHYNPGAIAFERAFQVEQAGRFGLWLPNPMWTFDETAQPGQLTARAALYEASVSLIEVDQLDDDVQLDSAADTVLRWLRFAHGDLRVKRRDRVPVRDTDAVRVLTEFERQRNGARPVISRCDVYVFRGDGILFALCCEAPLRAFALLAEDFDSIVKTIELHRDGFDPELHGPLASRRKSKH